MKKLLTLVGAASVASASSSASLSDSRIRGEAMTPALHRALEDGGYAYMDDLTGRQIQYSHCVRAKIPQEGDDDAVEGNVNFYNGRYHAQYQMFATFHMCGDGGNSNQCSSCDYDVEYAMELNQYLETMMGNYEEICNMCGYGGRRLEEEGGDNNANLDCSSYDTSCKNYYKGGNDGNDESQYLECQAGEQDGDGLQLYYGPQCSDDGEIIIGVFYDDECTIKTKQDSLSFDYYKFDAVMEGCVDCSDDAGAEACGDLYGEAYHCVNGNDKRGQDNEMSVCSSVKKALMNVDYSGVKRHSAADAFVKVFFGLLLISVVGGMFFLAYTYYVRHRGEKSQPMLSAGDLNEDLAHTQPQGTTQGQSTPAWTTIS